MCHLFCGLAVCLMMSQCVLRYPVSCHELPLCAVRQGDGAVGCHHEAGHCDCVWGCLWADCVGMCFVCLVGLECFVSFVETRPRDDQEPLIPASSSQELKLQMSTTVTKCHFVFNLGFICVYMCLFECMASMGGGVPSEARRTGQVPWRQAVTGNC